MVIFVNLFLFLLKEYILVLSSLKLQVSHNNILVRDHIYVDGVGWPVQKFLRLQPQLPN